MNIERSEKNLNKIIKSFLERQSVLQEPTAWIIKKSSLGGFGLFATRDLNPGDVIFKDSPVIFGPRSGAQCSQVCVCCLKKANIYFCEKNCGLPVCSIGCQESSKHQKECYVISKWKNEKVNVEDLKSKIYRCLSPIRSLMLNKDDREVVSILKAHLGGHHGFEIDILKDDIHLNIEEDEELFMRYVCAVLDANAFEVCLDEENQSSLRGLYPLASLANHSCVPNSFHVFDENQKMISRASVFIKKGGEIFITYSRVMWGAPTRRYHLSKTKHFFCKCSLCSDPTEFKTYISALACTKCRGNVIPLDPLKVKSKWKCEDCNDLVDVRVVSGKLSALGSILATLNEENVEFMKKFLFEKLPKIVSSNNQVVIETEYKMIWSLGYSEGYKWEELSPELLLLKERCCRHILNIFKQMGLGMIKIRGLLLYELYCSLKWLKIKAVANGETNSEVNSDMELNTFLQEAADILLFDVGAPKELKELWQNRQ